MRGLRPAAAVTDSNEQEQGSLSSIKAIRGEFPSLFTMTKFDTSQIISSQYSMITVTAD